MTRPSRRSSRLAKVSALSACVYLFAHLVHAAGPEELPPIPRPAAEGPAAAVPKLRQGTPEAGILSRTIKAEGFGLWLDGGRVRPPKPIRVEASTLLQHLAAPGPRQAPWVQVNGSVVNLRAEPGIAAQRVGRFARGTRLRLMRRQGEWSKITNPQTGEVGWMHNDFLVDTPPPETAAANPAPNQGRPESRAAALDEG